MIRRGRKEGWLKLPISSLQPWAQFNGVTFNGIKCQEIPGSGSGVVADRDLNGGEEGPLMVIPHELVLSLERVKSYALSDQDLSEILNALGAFARVSIFFSIKSRVCGSITPNTYALSSFFSPYVYFTLL